MFYEINLKKLNKVIGNNIKFEGNSILVEQITSYIKEGRVNIEESDNIETKILKHATELIINHTEQQNSINLNLGNEEGLPEEIFEDWKSISEYIANKNNNKEKITCNIKGENKVIEGLIGKFSEKIEPPLKFTSNKKNINIVWEIPQEMLIKSWGDKNYVIKKISSTSDQYLKESFKLIADELWEDRSFIDALFTNRSKEIKEYIPNKVMNGEVFKEYLSNNLNKFVLFWEKGDGYEEMAQTISKHLKEKLQEKYGEMDKVPYGSSLLNYLNEVELENNQIVITGEYSIKIYTKEDLDNLKYIYKNIFSDKEKCKAILGQKLLSEESVQYFSPEVQMDDEIIDLVAVEKYKSSYRSIGILKDIPKEYFNEEDKSINFLKKHINLVFDRTEDSAPEYIKKYLNNKDLCIELIKKTGNNTGDYNPSLRKLKENMPRSILSSKEVLKELIVIGDPDLNYMDKEHIDSEHFKLLNKDKEIQEFILTNKKYEIFSKLPKDIIFSLTKKEDIIGMIKRNYELLQDEKVPAGWKEDIDIVCAADSKISWLNLSKSDIKKLCVDKESTKKILRTSPVHIFNKLPKEMKLDPINVLITLNELKNKSELSYSAENIIDKSLWASYDFCYKAINISELFLKSIPETYWDNQDFIKGLFEKIDQGNMRSQIINVMPGKIKKCLDAFDVQIGEYSSFAEKFFGQQNLQKNLQVNTAVSTKKMKI